MKISSKPKDKRKDLRDLCPYCSRPGHMEEKCYYKHPERASQNFRERFKDRIQELQSKANATRSHTNVEVNIDNASEHFSSENRGLIVQTKGRILATGGHDKNWYFDNAASYHMTFDLADFQESELTKCQHPRDDITLADGSTILPDGIGTVPLLFCVNGQTEKISLSGVRYCSQLDTKLISLGMLDRKGLAYSSQHGNLSVRDSSSTIMVGRLTPHNLYKVDLFEASNKVSAQPAYTEIDFSRAMTAGTSKSATDLSTWHRRLAHLNEASVKRLSTMVTGMEIVQSSDKTPPLCKVCIEAKMTRQPHRDARTHSSQPGFRLHADVGGGGQTYTTFRGFRYFIIFICEATGHVWVRFMKQKSEALSIFQNLVTLIFWQHSIWVCILYTKFGKFNSNLIAKYFKRMGIIWESSGFTPNNKVDW